ncbi:MAG: GtrA family protein [bacterium]
MKINKKIKAIVNRFFKFGQVGVVVTLLSMSLSFFFLKIIGTPLYITYILLYLSMILLSYTLNAHFTFKKKWNFKSLLLYYFSYAFSMIIGLIILYIFRNIFPFENWIISYMVIPFTMTSNFLLATKIFKNEK